VHLDLRDDVREPADVVLMAVGEEDTAEVAHPLHDEADVRDDEVDPSLLFFRELAAGVEQDDIVPALDRGHVLADLADPAERDHTEHVVANWFQGSVSGLVLSYRATIHALLVATRTTRARGAAATLPLLILTLPLLLLSRLLLLLLAASPAATPGLLARLFRLLGLGCVLLLLLARLVAFLLLPLAALTVPTATTATAPLGRAFRRGLLLGLGLLLLLLRLLLVALRPARAPPPSPLRRRGGLVTTARGLLTLRSRWLLLLLLLLPAMLDLRLQDLVLLGPGIRAATPSIPGLVGAVLTALVGLVVVVVVQKSLLL
jgi:hypothetical protein